MVRGTLRYAVVGAVLAAVTSSTTAVPAGAVPARAAAQAGAVCRDPEFVTSEPDDMWVDGRYVVHNNMWNASGYDVTQTLRACSHRRWRVTVTADDSAHDGAVKTYPNVHRDFHDWESGAEPRLSSFARITSTWRARTPGVGVYDAAYDIWLDGVPGEHEVMIWTDNRRQVPAGRVVARGLSFAGERWRLWAGDGNAILTLVPARRLTHGTLPLGRMLRWLVRHDRLPRDTTLGQICFGFEVVSTEGGPATFAVSDFSVTARKR